MRRYSGPFDWIYSSDEFEAKVGQFIRVDVAHKAFAKDGDKTTAQTVVWQSMTEDVEEWQNYPDEAQRALEEAWQKNRKGTVRFKIGGGSFDVDFSTMKQTNVQDRTRIRTVVRNVTDTEEQVETSESLFGQLSKPQIEKADKVLDRIEALFGDRGCL